MCPNLSDAEWIDMKIHWPADFAAACALEADTRLKDPHFFLHPSCIPLADVDFLTVGQYLQPTVKHAAVDRFVTPEEFADYAALARGKGFLLVSATPLTRSSYHADADFAALRAAREAAHVVSA